MKFDILTPFPSMLEPVFQESMLKRAQEKDIVSIKLWDLRAFSDDKHRTVDDYPYGGGAGMILKPEPIFKAVDKIKESASKPFQSLIYLSPQGERFTQEKAWELTQHSHVVLLCGHYRGIDERVIDSLVTEEISIGDYILTGGELGAAVIVDAVSRLLPGVLGDFDSAEGDSFNGDMLDYPHYTRPEEFRDLKVPEVLLSGHHANINAWRKEMALERTRKKRPDLLKKNMNE